jgi:tetratricopeptide (TPR) repeat protein
LIELDRHAEAMPLVERALADSPEDEELLDLLAQAQLEVDPGAAATTAARLAGIAPDSYRGYLIGSLAASQLGRGRDAIGLARRSVELAPWDARARSQLAQSLVGRRFKYREALREAEEAVALAPEDTGGYVTAGNVELGRGRLRRAKRWYEQALEVDPADGIAQHNVALTSKVQGRMGASLGEVTALLAVDPRDERGRTLLDEVVYTTLVHLQWVVVVLAFAVGLLRGSW